MYIYTNLLLSAPSLPGDYELHISRQGTRAQEEEEEG